MERMVTSAAGLTLAALLVLTATEGRAQEIGQVEVVRVWAYGTPPGGERGDLFRSNPVHQGETVETVRNGELRVRFADGTTLGMAGDSTIVLDELVYDGGAGDVLAIELSQGFFHFVTGDIAPEAVQISTPAMVIGVRGTDLAISVGEDGSTELGVRDGTATAAPAAGGDTVDVDTGNTATAEPGDTSVDVSPGLSAAAAGAMPGSGFGGSGGGSSHGGGPASEPDRPEAVSSPY